MGRSRRKYKNSRAKVRVGLPKKKPGVFKPAFTVPDKLLEESKGGAGETPASSAVWDEKGSVIKNYKAFGVVSNPNFLGVCARTSQIVQVPSLQVPRPGPPERASEFDPIDSGSDLESDDLKSTLGKRRRDGKKAPLQPLTKIQRVHIGRLIDKYGDDYEAMFRDIKLNSMQHSVATLRKLCQRCYLPAPKFYLDSK